MSGTKAEFGQPCPCAGCQGRISVYSTRINFAQRIRIRYLGCDTCGHKPNENKQIVPLEFAPVRAFSSKTGV